MVAEAQPGVAEQLRELVRAVVQLAVGDRLTGRGHDVRELVRPFARVLTGPHATPRSSVASDRARPQNEVMTLRMTSPFSIAVNASFTSSSLIVCDTIAAVSRRPVSMRSTKRWKSRRT